MTIQTKPIDLKTLRRIHLALTAGLVIFTAVVLVAGPVGEPNPELGLILLGVAVGLAMVEVAAFQLLPRTLLAALREHPEEARRRLRAGEIPHQLAALAIVRAALAEGPGLLGCVGLLVTGYLPLLVMPLLSIVAILLFLPDQERLERALKE